MSQSQLSVNSFIFLLSFSQNLIPEQIFFLEEVHLAGKAKQFDRKFNSFRSGPCVN